MLGEKGQGCRTEQTKEMVMFKVTAAKIQEKRVSSHQVEIRTGVAKSGEVILGGSRRKSRERRYRRTENKLGRDLACLVTHVQSSPRVAEAGLLPQVQSHSVLHREFQSQRKTDEKRRGIVTGQ